jgi:hypothetical protein
MLSRLQTALKFLTYGVLIGIFFAPASGAENRQRVMNWVSATFRELLGNLTGGDSR